MLVPVARGIYAHNMAGLMACYAAALPFLGMQVLGDLGYTALFFGAHALASKNVVALRSESVEMQLASEGAGEHVPLADADEEMANKTAATEVVIA